MKTLPVAYESVFHWMVSVHGWGWVALIDKNHDVTIDIVGIDFKVYEISDLYSDWIIWMHLHISVISIHDKMECEISISTWKKNINC